MRQCGQRAWDARGRSRRVRGGRPGASPVSRAPACDPVSPVARDVTCQRPRECPRRVRACRARAGGGTWPRWGRAEPWVRVLGAVVVAFTCSSVSEQVARLREIISPDLVTTVTPAHGSVLVGASGLYGVRGSAIRATYGHPPCGTHTTNNNNNYYPGPCARRRPTAHGSHTRALNVLHATWLDTSSTAAF